MLTKVLLVTVWGSLGIEKDTQKQRVLTKVLTQVLLLTPHLGGSRKPPKPNLKGCLECLAPPNGVLTRAHLLTLLLTHYFGGGDFSIPNDPQGVLLCPPPSHKPPNCPPPQNPPRPNPSHKHYPHTHTTPKLPPPSQPVTLRHKEWIVWGSLIGVGVGGLGFGGEVSCIICIPASLSLSLFLPPSIPFHQHSIYISSMAREGKRDG